MKELIARDDMGVFADVKETVRVDSVEVARLFNKKHWVVLRAIDNLLRPDSGLDDDFRRHNFVATHYRDSQGRRQPAYAMTRDGFLMVVFGFTGAKAVAVKQAYIRRFNAMEEHLAALLNARSEFPLLTDAIRNAHETPKPYHYSNECDMLNRLVLGMSAAQYRAAHAEIPEGARSIRPYLSAEDTALLDTLQRVDVGLLVAFPDDYQARRDALARYMTAHGRAPLWAAPKRGAKVLAAKCGGAAS